MSLRRGFKASANRLSLRLRRSQGLAPEAPIDLNIVARRLSLEIIPLSDFRDECPNAVRQLVHIDSGAFSAATVPCDDGQRVLVHNDSHDVGRQSSNIAHELSHVLLGHPFTLPIDTSGCRNLDRDVEDQANWLSGTILISDEAAVHIVRMNMTAATACDLYRVSAPMLRMRLNASGAYIRVSRRYH